MSIINLAVEKDKELITDIQREVLEYLSKNEELIGIIIKDETDCDKVKEFLTHIKTLRLTQYENVINLKTVEQEVYFNHITSDDDKSKILKGILNTKISVIYKYNEAMMEKYKNLLKTLNEKNAKELIQKLKELFDATFRIWASDA